MNQSHGPGYFHLDGYRYTKKEAKQLSSGDIAVYYRCCHWRKSKCSKTVTIVLTEGTGKENYRKTQGGHLCKLEDQIATQDVVDVRKEMGDAVRKLACDRGNVPAFDIANDVLQIFDSRFSGKR